MKEFRRQRMLLTILVCMFIIGLVMWLIPAEFTSPRWDITALIMGVTGGGTIFAWVSIEGEEFLSVLFNRPNKRIFSPRVRL